jgi:hypothetical protein
MTHKRDPVFIVGTGRCGSTLISNLLRNFSNGLSLSEFFTVLGGPRAFTTEIVDAQRLWELLSKPSEDVLGLLEYASNVPELLYTKSDLSRIGDTNHLAPLMLVPLPHISDQPELLFLQLRDFVFGLPSEPISKLFTRIFEWLQHRHQKQYWFERSGGSVVYLDHLIRHWPQAKFVHMTRDGIECALSMSRHPFFRLQVSRLIHRDQTIPVSQALLQDIPIDRFGAYWSALVTRCVASLKNLPKDQVLHINYKELIQRPQTTLSHLFRFLDEQQPNSQHLLQMCSRIQPMKTLADELEKSSKDALAEACGPGSRALERLLRQS